MQQPREPDPLSETTTRLESALRRRALRQWLLFAALLGGGGLTASKSGVLEAILPSPKDSAFEQRVSGRLTNMERKINWLVLQEVRRQVREGTIVNPPEDTP